MAHKIFVNIAVKDLKKTRSFFDALGLGFDVKFTDNDAACMTINEGAYFMLVVEKRFREFTRKALCDASKQTEAILGLSVDSKGEVDTMVTRALASGATPAGDPVDHGFMYTWSFNDPDGHLWEIFWMDPFK